MFKTKCRMTEHEFENVNYSDEDFYTEWRDSDFTKVKLQGASATADGPGGVAIEEGKIEIRTSGTYVLEGSLDNGQVVIHAENKGTGSTRIKRCLYYFLYGSSDSRETIGSNRYFSGARNREYL